MARVLHRTIAGKPYVLTRNGLGWGVTNITHRTDNFHKSYQVYCLPKGEPLRCSCPDCALSKRWCKHLRAIEVLYLEDHPEEAQRRREEAARCGFRV